MAEIQQLPFTFEQTVVLNVDELWTLATPELLVLAREDRRIERKPPAIHASELAEYFSMWANTSVEGGVIAVGISNKGDLSGCLSIELEHINKLESDAHNLCVDASVECKKIKIKRAKDGLDDFVLLFRVHYHPTKVVHTAHGDAFIRRGEQKHKLTSHEIRDLQNDKGEVRVEQELCAGYVFPDSFNADLLADFLRGMRSVLTESHDDEEILVNRRLGVIKAGKFIPNAACVLLFADDPVHKFPGSKVRFLRFEGEQEGTGSEWNAVKDEFIEGPIPYLIQTTERLLQQQLRTFSRQGPDQRFNPVPEYPKEAWYEAVVNACVHRSYGTLKNVPIFVKMFDNRLEIISPGAFPPSVTPQTIYGTHSPRNPNLMSALWSMNLVKCAAEGTRRMLRLMEASELPPPEFAQKTTDHAVVRVTLRNNIRQRRAWIDAAASSVISPDIDRTLTQDERQVINHVAEHGTINTMQAVRLVGKKWKAAHKMLLRLESRKLLKYHHRKDIERDPQAFFTLVIPRQKRI